MAKLTVTRSLRSMAAVSTVTITANTVAPVATGNMDDAPSPSASRASATSPSSGMAEVAMTVTSDTVIVARANSSPETP